MGYKKLCMRKTAPGAIVFYKTKSGTIKNTRIHVSPI
jgi:hypothetical protein